jgi:hypothetical protein
MRIATLLLGGCGAVAAGCLLAAGPTRADDTANGTAAEEPRVLRGDQEGTVFRSMTVTGEDRVRIQFDRPELRLDLDPRQAPGLEWGDPMSALSRSGPDLVGPLRDVSALDRSPYLPRPWLHELRSGAVARFRPDLDEVAEWRLTVADSRSDTLAVFQGDKKPPEEIVWDGRTPAGEMVLPGVTCSYVLEASDRAGNRRSFVGPGFTLPPYRIASQDGTTILFEVSRLGTPTSAAVAADIPPPILLEAASWLNQVEPADGSIEIRVTGADYEGASALAGEISAALGRLVVGDPARIRAVADVRADVPDRGVVTITAARTAGQSG